MKERFEGASGAELLAEQMRRQKTLRDAPGLAEPLIAAGSLVEVAAGEALITEGAEDTDIYFIIAGQFEVRIRGNYKATRGPGDAVGDFVSTDPSMRRSASIVATGPNAALRVPLEAAREITKDAAAFWRAMHAESSKRALETSSTLKPCNEVPRFIIFSAGEARKLMGEIIINLNKFGYETVPWDDAFAISSYPLPSLVEKLGECDFAIAIASGEDVVISRCGGGIQPRDNVTLEFGLAAGILTIDRTILLAEDNKDLKLASDTGGLTYVPYKNGNPDQLKSQLRAACERIRAHADIWGVRPK